MQELSAKTFAIVVDIVKATLREANNSKDYKSAKSFIDLSSIFFTVNESGHAIFMIDNIVGHELWQNYMFWVDLFSGLLEDLSWEDTDREKVITSKKTLSKTLKLHLQSSLFSNVQV